MKKIILLGVLVLLLSGCTVDYNIYIGKDKIHEQVIFEKVKYNFPRAAFFDEVNYSEDDDNDYIDGIEYYSITTNKDNDSIYTYNFKTDDYKRSYAVNSCVTSMNMSVSNGVYSINPSNYYACFDQYPDLTKINVNINLDTNNFEMISNNADSVKNNTYTWVIDTDNYMKKSISLKYKDKSVVEKKEEDEISSWASNHFGLITLGIIVALGLLIFGITKFNSKK